MKSSQSEAPNQERHYHPKYQHVRTKKPVKHNFQKKAEHPHDNTPSSTWWLNQPIWKKYDHQIGRLPQIFRLNITTIFELKPTTECLPSSAVFIVEASKKNNHPKTPRLGSFQNMMTWNLQVWNTFFSKGKKHHPIFQVKIPNLLPRCAGHQDGTPKPIKKTLWYMATFVKSYPPRNGRKIVDLDLPPLEFSHPNQGSIPKPVKVPHTALAYVPPPPQPPWWWRFDLHREDSRIPGRMPYRCKHCWWFRHPAISNHLGCIYIYIKPL